MEARIVDDEGEEQDAILPVITHDESRFQCSLFGYQQSEYLRESKGYREIMRNFEVLEMYCDAPNELMTDYKCSVDISFEEALSNPRKVSNPIPLNLPPQMRLTSQTIKMIWCRLISHCFEWMAGLPELRYMSNVDKARLVSSHVYKVLILNYSYLTYASGWTVGLQLGYGLYFKPTDLSDLSALSNLSKLAHVVQTRVVKLFKEINLHHKEYLILKLIMLMSNTEDIGISEESRDILKKALEKYHNLLKDYCFDTYPHLSEEEIVDRINKIESSLNDIEIARETNKFCVREWTIRNDGDIQGRLTNEMHLLHIRK